MPIRITGMNSGLDTESIIAELVKVQKTKVDTIKKKQTSLQWKQDAWKDLNSRITKLFSGSIGNMRFQSAYMKKTTKVSNSDAVSVITGSNAVNGVQELEIEQLAKTGYLTGGQLKGDTAYTATNKLSEIDSNNFGNGESGVINVTIGGVSKDISIGADTSISDILTQLKEAGLNANFDEKNQRFFISAKESGEENDFSITASDSVGARALEALKINTSLENDKASLAEYTEYAAYVGATDADTIANMSTMIDKEVASRKSALESRNEEINKSLEEAQKQLDELDGKYATDKTSAELQEQIKTIEANLKDKNSPMTEEEKEVAKEQLKELKETYTNTKKAEDLQEKITKLNDEKADNDTYLENDGQKIVDEVTASYLNKANYAKEVMTAYNNGTLAEAEATRIAGQDAVVYLNDAKFVSNTNNFEINGLTINALKANKGEKITVTTQDDTDGIYDMIKSFIKEYNAIINEMDKLYNADSAKDYEPLTDEEKEEMSEKEIEKWEEKIKDSILRRDDTLSAVSSAMKSIMSAGVEVNGKKMYLSDFGIDTLNYFTAAKNEKNAYHIAGDEDDDNTKTKADVLKGMIATDPETVTAFFSQLSKNLYSRLNDFIKRTDYSSYNSVYDDIRMKEEYDEYTKKIAAQEAKVLAMENKYYKQFSAMETALAKLQSNQSAITSLLGG